MARRFTETTKWSDPWFRALSPKLKAFWLYLLDNCDPAGVWPVDFDLASFCIGDKVSESEVREAFQKRIIFFCEAKILVLKFIHYQYGTLSQDCKMHRPVYASLTKNGLNYDNLKGIDTLSIGFETLQVQDKEQVKGKDQEKEKTRVEEIHDFKSHPWFADQGFSEAWKAWGRERKKKGTERNFGSLRKLSGESLPLAIQILNQSADNGWKGLFGLKTGQTFGSAKSEPRQNQKAKEYDEHLTL